MPPNPNTSIHLLAQIQSEVGRRATELAARRTSAPVAAAVLPIDSVEEWGGVPLQWGELLQFCQEGNGLSYLRGGWSKAESASVWSDGPSATVLLPPFQSSIDVLLCVTATAFTGTQGFQPVTLLVNGLAVATWHVKEQNHYFALLPASIIGLSKQPTTLRFQIANPCSPKMCGLGDDPRLLGMALHALEVRPF